MQSTGTAKTEWVAAFDSSAGAALALAQGVRVVARRTLPAAERERDADLAAWCLAACREAGVSLAGIRSWTVGLGPGSFSGLRAGIAFVQGVALGSGARVRGLPSSLGLARMAVDEARAVPARVGVLHDARRGQLIVSVWVFAGGGWREAGSAGVREPGDVAAELAACDYLVTPHAATVAPRLEAAARARLQAVEALDAATLLAPPGWSWPVAGDEAGTDAATLGAVAALEPIYVRPPVFVPPQPSGPLPEWLTAPLG